MTTAGGRVVTVTGMGPTLKAARQRAYTAVDAIRWPGMEFRTDIAASACEPSAVEHVARRLP